MTSFRKFSIALLVVAALAGFMAAPAQAVTVSCNPPATATVNISFSMPCSVTGGLPVNGYGFQISAGVPPGLTPYEGATEVSFQGTPLTAGTYTFTVTATDSVGASGSQTVTIVVAPAGGGGGGNGTISLTQVSPTTLVAGNATVLYVYGSNFTTNSIIHFNNAVFTTSYVTSGQLYATISGAYVTQGTLPVYVSDPTNGTSSTMYVTVSGSGSGGSLALSSISPTSAAVGAQAFVMNLYGSGFSAGSLLNFGSVCTLSTVFVSSGQLQATIPSTCLTTAQTVNVTVGNSNSVQFTIGGSGSSGSITLSSLSQTTFSAGVQVLLYFYGSNFTPNTQVHFNGYTVTGSYQSSSTIYATIPGAYITSGSLPVYVSDPTYGTSNTIYATVGGSGSSGIITLTQVSPTTLTPAVSASLILLGTNFTANSLVHFNGTAIQPQYVNSAELIATIPASIVTSGALPVYVTDNTNGTSGTVYVTVSGSGSNGSFSLSPTSAPVGSGFTLTIYGSGFSQGVIVTFGTCNINTTFINSGQLTAFIPATCMTTAGTVNVSVGSNTAQFTIGGSSGSGSITLSSMSQSTFTAGVQVLVYFYGANFTSNTQIHFNGYTATGTFQSSSTIYATIPGQYITSGSLPVYLTDPTYGQSNTIYATVGGSGSTGIITLSSISPTTLTPSTGASLILTGTNFTSSSLVFFNGTSVQVQYVNSTQLIATIPASLVTSGNLPVYVFDSVNGTSGTQFATVSGSGSGSGGVTITSISPSSAVLNSNPLTLNIFGSGFTAGLLLNFGNVCSAATNFINSTQIQATLPTSCFTTAQTVNITVGSSNAISFAVGGGGSGSGSLSVSCSPATGPVTVGTSYTQTCSVTGGTAPYTWTVSGLPAGLSQSAYTGGSTVTISGTPTSSQSYAYTVQVTDNTSPTHLTGSLSVTGTVGSGNSGYNITSLSPSTIAVGTASTNLNVFGNGFTGSSQVYFNGTPLSTTYVSATQLYGLIPSTSLNASQTASISVNTLGNYTNTLTLVVGTGSSGGGGALSVNCTPGVGPQTVAISFSATCTATGGIQPYNWTVPGLPGYLALSATTGSSITLTGTPSSAGPYNYTVKVTDSSSPVQTGSLQIAGQVTSTTSNGGVVITSLSPTSAALNAAAFTLNVFGSGFTSNSQIIFDGFAVTTTYQSGSQLTGTITAGLLTFSRAAQVTVTTPGAGTSNALSFLVGTGAVNQTSISCSPGVGPSSPNLYYSTTCSVNGGNAPFTWSISAGALPAGLTLNPGSVSASISGLTTLNGPYSYTLQVTDNSSPPITSFVVFAGTTGAGSGSSSGVSISSLSPSSVTPGSQATTITISGTGFATNATAYFNGTALATTFVNAGALSAIIPANLLTQATTASITVNSAGVVTNALTFTVGTVSTTGITVSCTPDVGPTTTSSYTTTCTATGGKAPYTWSVTSGFLPQGLVQSNSNSSQVTISGFVFISGSSLSLPYGYTIQVADSSLPVQTAGFPFAGTLSVTAAGSITSLNPISAPVGGGQFTLTVQGTGFQPGLSTVYWGGTPLATSYFSSNQLTAIVPSNLIATIGQFPISVQTAGYGTTSQVSFFVSGASAVVVAPTSLSFTYGLGGTLPPGQTLNVSSSIALGGFSVAVNAFSNNITWLSATPSSSTFFPTSVSVSVAPGNLPIGTYNGTITVTGFGVGTGVVVPVTLTVTGPPTMVAAPTSLTFNSGAGSTAPTQTLKISASDGNTVFPFTAKAVANNGGTWLSVTPSSGSTPGTLTVTASATGLAAATYSGAITITPTGNTGNTLSIPVTFTVTAATNLSASPSTLTFNGVTGQSNPANQTITISSTGGSTAVSYTVAATTTTGGSWLSATASNGTTPGNIAVSANLSGLAAGTYNGSVTITANGASNSPLTVPVTFVVAGATTLSVTPQTLTFNFGGAQPASQTVAVTTTNGVTANYTVTASSTGNWLSATASGTTPGTITVSVNVQSMAVGQYTGTLSIASPGATNTPQTVTVTLNVTPPPSILAAPQSLSFFVPGDGSIPGPQTVTVISTGGNTSFTASATAQGGNWLNVSGSGTTPGSIMVTVNPAGLAAGQTYNGVVSISAPASNPNNLQVPVTLTLAPTGNGPLLAAPSALYLTYSQGAGTDLQHILVINNGGGSESFSVQGGPNGLPAGAPPSTCGNWLNLITQSGAATASTPAVVAFTVNPSGVNAQTCAGSIAINTPFGQTVVPVYMAVSNGTQAIQLSQTALNFVAAANGPAPAGQTFQILNPGSGSMPWNITTSTLSGGSWLSATPNSGNSQSLSQPGSPITVGINTQGLAAGTYYGTVQVTSSGVPNSPQSITVSLTLLPPGANPPAQVSPAGVILTSTNGTSNTQMVNVTNSGSNTLTYSTILSTDDGQSWLTATPTSGSIGVGSTNAVSLSAALNNIGTGLRHGTLRLVFSDGSVQTVDVLLAISGSANGANGVRSCGSSDLALEFLSPQQNFQSTAQVAVPVQVLVQDCNGNALTSSNTGVDVLAGSSNTDLRLAYTGNGVWSGTWTPGAANTAATLSARAIEVTGSSAATGTVTANGSTGAPSANAPPYISAVVNAGSFLFPGLVSPGAMVSIFGNNLTDGTSQVFSTPFPPSLQGAQFSIRGLPLSLFYASSGQVNAVLPIGLTADVRDQLIVVRDTTQSAPVDLLVGDTSPGVFTVNSQGTGQAAALVGGTAQIAAPVGSIPGANAAPATVGQTISLFLSGMGTVTNPPADGSPSTGTSLTNFTPIVSIGGAPATVAYSGLAPGEVGLYQLNVVIPAGTQTGNAVPIFVNIGGENVNFTTIAIQ